MAILIDANTRVMTQGFTTTWAETNGVPCVFNAVMDFAQAPMSVRGAKPVARADLALPRRRLV
jgi:hypothetical protein